MLGWVVRASLQFRYLVSAIAAASGVCASYALTDYALTQPHFDVLPEFSPPPAAGMLAVLAVPARNAVLAGLITSTLVTLFVISAFCLSFGENSIEGQRP